MNDTSASDPSLVNRPAGPGTPAPASAAATDEAADRRALAAPATLHRLADETLVRVQGADAASFLQAQFSNDIGLLGPDNAQWTSYCTPQGRVLAMPLAWKMDGVIRLAMPADLAAPVVARLRRYVLRARVEFVDDAEQAVLLGVGGTDAAATIAAACGAAPGPLLGRIDGSGGESVIRLADDLFLLAVPAARAHEVRDALARSCTPASERAWHARLLRARIPRLGLALQDRFVPQMLGLDRLGGISFDKGCYPGQEIVARARYLGQVKRHLAALHAAQGPAVPGQSIVRADGTGAGTVVSAAPAADSGWDVLAVLLDEAAAAGGLRLEGTDVALTRID